jgi:hypothetical protein
MVFTALLGNAFQQWTFLCSWAQDGPNGKHRFQQFSYGRMGVHCAIASQQVTYLVTWHDVAVVT